MGNVGHHVGNAPAGKIWHQEKNKDVEEQKNLLTLI